MSGVQLPSSAISDEMVESLFMTWVSRFGEERFALAQSGSGSSHDGVKTYTFGDPTSNHFILERASGREWIVKSRRGLDLNDIQKILDDGLNRVQAQDLGEDIVYETTLRTHPPELLDGAFALNFARTLGDQVRIAGLRRLSDRVILNFVEENEADDQPFMLFAPTLNIRATVIVPGPKASGFSQAIATGALELTAAICALATGRAVSVEPVLFPASDEERDKALRSRSDSSILTLARDSQSLDIFGEMGVLGGIDGMNRLRGALLSYHAAWRQSNVDIATMLYVISMESLFTPPTKWAPKRVTKRFVDSLLDLCPDAIAGVLDHPNCEQAFNYRQKGGELARKRQLLNRIYTLRSLPSHSGIGLSSVSALVALADPGGLRVALLSDLSRAAILAFLQAPRSSLIGHPMHESPDESQS